MNGTGRWNGRLRILVASVSRIRVGHRGARVTGFVRGSHVMVVLLRFEASDSGHSGRGKLSVPGGCLLAVKETLAAGARRVIIRGRRAIALFLPVMPHQKYLEKGTEEEKNTMSSQCKQGHRHQLIKGLQEDDGHGKHRLLQSTRDFVTRTVATTTGRGRSEFEGAVSIPKRRVDVSTATMGTGPGQDGHGDESTQEEDVQDQGQSSKGGDPSDEAGQERSNDSPKDSGSSDALDGLNPGGLVEVMTGQHGEEVREDTENQGGGE